MQWVSVLLMVRIHLGLKALSKLVWKRCWEAGWLKKSIFQVLEGRD